MTNLLIGYPDIPYSFSAAYTGTSTVTAASGFPLSNLVGGSSGESYKLATAIAPAWNYKFTSATGRAGNFFYINRADLLQRGGGTAITVSGALASAAIAAPTDIAGCQLWLDAETGVTYDSDNKVSAWLDRSTNATAGAQATDANKPLRTRADSRENWFIYSEQIDNAAWVKSSPTVAANQVAGPLKAEITADQIIESAGLGTQYFRDSGAFYISGKSYRASIYAKANGRDISIMFGTTFPSSTYAKFNLTTGVVGASGADSTPTITNMGNGWYRCSVTATATSTGTGYAYFYLENLVSTAAPPAAYVGDGVSGAYVIGAQLARAASSTDYVATTITQQVAGVNGKHTLYFDGSNDYIDLSNPASLQIAGDVSLFAVFRTDQFSAVAQRILWSEVVNVSGYQYSLNSVLQPIYRSNQAGVHQDVTASSAVTNSEGVASVISAIKSAGTVSMRVNLAAAGSAAVTNPVNQTSYTIGSSSNSLQGQLCEIIIYNSALSTTNRDKVETYLSNRWRATPSASSFDFANETLVGPHGKDFIKTFTTTAANDYWNVDINNESTSTYPMSKLMLGSGFDFGVDPKYPRTLNRKILRVDNYAVVYGFSFTWEGVTTAIMQNFIDKIFKRRDVFPVVLYTVDYHDVLNEHRCIYAKIVDGEFEPITDNTYRVRLEFEELL